MKLAKNSVRQTGMKSLCLIAVLFAGIVLMCSINKVQPASASDDEDALKNIDAKKAVAIANDWKWSKKDVKSYITSQEIVFEFPDGQKTSIALPKDKMYVAITPYIKKTHP